MRNSKKKFEPSVTPITRAEIAEAINISYTTFWRWLVKNDISLPNGRVYYVEQKKIYEKLYGEKYDV